MKKGLSLLLVLFVFLTCFIGCGTKEDDTTLRVSVLSGTTGFGMARLMTAEKDNERFSFSIENDASVVTAGLISGNVDIAALPTNAASVVYNVLRDDPDSGITVLAVNTLGVLYVTENGSSIGSFSDLDGKKVYCPAQNPAFILQYLAGINGISIDIDTTYAQPAALMSFVAVSEPGTIAVLPEPVLSVALSKNHGLRNALDLTAEWNASVHDSSLVQGCLVVRNEFLKNHEALVKSFLADYKASICFLNENVTEAAQMVVDLGLYTGSAALAAGAIPRCNVVYLDKGQMKTALEGFLAAMASVNPASIGKQLPGDDFYYIPDEK